MTSLINFSFIKEILNIANTVNYKSGENQILEPFSTILNLVIISFKEKGTKLAIQGDTLYIQSPSFYQGGVRWFNGNKREEIHYLLKPLIRCVELYPPEKESLKVIYKCAVHGLRVLKKSYNNSSSTLCHTIDLYIQILDNSVLNKSIHIDSLKEDDNITENMSTNTKVNLNNYFKGIWSTNDILIIASLINSIEQTKNNKNICDPFLSSIQNMIESKKRIIEEKINKARSLI
jgi:hypothetical protein